MQAAKVLDALAEVEVTAKRIERWTKRMGDQRVAELERAAADEVRRVPDAGLTDHVQSH